MQLSARIRNIKIKVMKGKMKIFIIIAIIVVVFIVWKKFKTFKAEYEAAITAQNEVVVSGGGTVTPVESPSIFDWMVGNTTSSDGGVVQVSETQQKQNIINSLEAKYSVNLPSSVTSSMLAMDLQTLYALNDMSESELQNLLGVTW